MSWPSNGHVLCTQLEHETLKIFFTVMGRQGLLLIAHIVNVCASAISNDFFQFRLHDGRGAPDGDSTGRNPHPLRWLLTSRIHFMMTTAASRTEKRSSIFFNQFSFIIGQD